MASLSDAYNKGDTITITGTVVGICDGDLELRFNTKYGESTEVLCDIDPTAVKLVARAIPPVPAPGTVIKVVSWATFRYIVKNSKGALRLIRGDGTTMESIDTWALIHAIEGVAITVLG